MYGNPGRAAEYGDQIAAVLFLAATVVLIAVDVIAASVALRWHTRRDHPRRY